MGRGAQRGSDRGRDGERSRGADSAEAETNSESENGTGNRGQTNVLGIILLIGMVAVGSVGLVVVGTNALESQRTAIETEHAQQSMLEFAQTAATTAHAGPDTSSGVALETFDEGDLELRDDGHVRVVHETDSEDVLYEDSLGTLAYETGDTEIAYQGGGVWRSDGRATASVSSPPVEFRDGRLRIPLIGLQGTEFRSDSFDGTVRRSAVPTEVGPGYHGLRDRTGDGGTIRIELTSAYCDGWERELEATIDGRVIESCSDGRADRVRFEIDVPSRIDGVDGAVIANEIDIHESAPAIDGDVRAGSVDEEKVNGTVYDEGYDYASVDAQIDAAVAKCETFEPLDEEVTDSGTYCTDRITGDHEFDTSEGDITVVVRGSIGDPNYQDDLVVEGDNDVTILVDGDLHARGDARIGNESDPSKMRLFFSSDSEVSTANGGPEIAALLYAPDSDVTFQGNPTLEGSVVGDRVEVDNINPGAISYHERVGEAEFRPGVGPRLDAAHITAYELTIDD